VSCRPRARASPGHGGRPGSEPVSGLGEHTAECGAGTRGGRGAGGQEATQRGGNVARFPELSVQNL